MDVLLFGKDGQVGWQLQRSLAPHGKLHALGRDDCDLSDLDAVRAAIRSVRPQVIVNAAAYTAVDRAEAEPAAAMLLNGEVPGVLAAEAARFGALLVHYSTDYVFDGLKATPYVETDPVAPQSAYGRSKLAGEQTIRSADCRALVFRTSWVFGARGGNFVKTILRLAAERDELGVVGDQVGSPTPAALIATVTGIALAILRQGRAMAEGEQRLYHLCSGRPVSWHEFARTIVGLASAKPGFDLRLTPAAIRSIASSEYPTPARRPANSRLDCSRLEADFGLAMPDWEPYLARMLQLLSLKNNGY